jgi:DNA-directed RNA polymerase subunit RPC12/RpoP
MAIIAIRRIETIDETVYSHVHCPQCNHKLCHKPKGSRVHILRISQKAKDFMESVLLTCKRCKSHYLISSEDKNV